MEILGLPRRGKNGNNSEVLKTTAQKLQNTLHSFGVEAHVTNVSCGPFSHPVRTDTGAGESKSAVSSIWQMISKAEPCGRRYPDRGTDPGESDGRH